MMKTLIEKLKQRTVNKMGIPETLLRISLGFLVLFIMTRTMGRKEISQMTFFNFNSAYSLCIQRFDGGTTKRKSLKRGFYLVTYLINNRLRIFFTISTKYTAHTKAKNHY